MRENLLFLFAYHKGDPERIRSSLRRWKTRSGFMEGTLKLTLKDTRWRDKMEAFVSQRTDARWAVARSAHAVLAEYGFLRD